MNILLTNDDGFGTAGITALAEVFSGHQVWIVAPDGERSGMSHSITINRPVRFEQRGERQFACSGNPADCVLYSLRGALPVRPDVVISGINHGVNLGTDLIYSGTAAASRQAVLMGVPGIAVSKVLNGSGDDWATGAAVVAEHLEAFLSLWRDSHFININLPDPLNHDTEIAVTKPSRRGYNDIVETFSAPDGSVYHFLRGKGAYADDVEGSDWAAVSSGRISVSPVHLHPQVDTDFNTYREVFGPW
ncbi:MAG: 5'/3'-nucleotidase SurE [Spirochaetales bacterium]|nr:5'/3'-nucleotidase SurE [Spirochaetales bacterium]